MDGTLAAQTCEGFTHLPWRQEIEPSVPTPEQIKVRWDENAIGRPPNCYSSVIKLTLITG